MGLLPSPSSLWRPVLYRWLTLPSHHCPSDAQWGGFWLFAAGYYFPRHFLMTLLNRSRLSWAQNQFCARDTKRQDGLFHATAQVRRQAPDPSWSCIGILWANTPCTVALLLMGIPKAGSCYLHFLLVMNAQVFWILMKPFTASFAGLKYSASNILFCSHFNQV